MAHNMCFENNPDVIADTLNAENSICLQDVTTALIGLCRIVARNEAAISNCRKDNSEAEKAVLQIRGRIANIEKAIFNLNEFNELIVEQLKKERGE